MDNLKAKKRHPEEIAVYTAIYVCAAFSVLLLLGIIIYVFAKGARRVNWAFLTGVTSILHGTVGIAGNILNTARWSDKCCYRIFLYIHVHILKGVILTIIQVQIFNFNFNLIAHIFLPN